jgi:hypothetical protein
MLQPVPLMLLTVSVMMRGEKSLQNRRRRTREDRAIGRPWRGD